jgi:hypothetical protein
VGYFFFGGVLVGVLPPAGVAEALPEGAAAGTALGCVGVWVPGMGPLGPLLGTFGAAEATAEPLAAGDALSAGASAGPPLNLRAKL